MGVRGGWSAARLERRGRKWELARELELNRERWVVRMRCERGYTEPLPDLAVWLKASAAPVAVIAESRSSLAHRINRLANKVTLAPT